MTSKTVALVVPQKDFKDEEFLKVKKILEGRGFIAKVVSKTRNKIFGKLGTELEPDLAIREVEAEDFIGVVFIGGPGAVSYFEDEDALKLAKDFKWLGKVVAAINIAPTILANAGCLISKTVTALHTEEANLKNRGADYTGMAVEVDGNIITAKDNNSILKFSEEVAFALEDQH